MEVADLHMRAPYFYLKRGTGGEIHPVYPTMESMVETQSQNIFPIKSSL